MKSKAKKRKLFDELVKVVEAMQEQREGKITSKGWRQNKFTFMGVKMLVQQGERKANSELFN